MYPRLSAKFVIAFVALVYAGLLTAAWALGADYVSLMLPWYRIAFARIAPDYAVLALTLVQQSGGDVIALSAQTRAPISAGGFVVPPGVAVASSTLAGHAVQHPLFLFGVLLAWPGLGIPRRLTLVALALPLLLVVEFLDIPFVLAGALRETLLAQTQPAALMYSPAVIWLHFLNGGGRIVLSLAAAMLAMGILRRLWPAPWWATKRAPSA